MKANQRSVLLMTCLLVAVVVLFVCPDQIPAWVFLILAVLVQMPIDRHHKILAKIKRIRKAIDK